MNYTINDYSDFSFLDTFDFNNYSTKLMSNSTWLVEWWDVFKIIEDDQIGKNKKLHIIVIQEDNELLIFPLVSLTRKIRGVSFRFLEILTQQWGGCESEILCSSKFAHHLIPIFFNYIKRNISHDILYFKYLLDDSCLFEKKKFFIHGISPYIPIGEHLNYDEFKKSNYSKNLKQNLRTAFNKLKREKYELSIVKTEFNKSYFELIQQVSKSKLIDGKRSVYLDSNKSMFYLNIYKTFKCNLILVKIHEKIVAYRVNIFYNDTKHCIDAAYDRKFKRFDLGAISVDNNISDSFDKNIYYHSMGPGADKYKFKFTKKVKFLYTYINKGNSLKSLFIYRILKYVVIKRQNRILENLK